MKKITFLFLVLFAFCMQNYAQTIVIGTGTDQSGNYQADPIFGFYNSFKYQTVYTAAELSASLTAYDEITALGWSISEDYGGGNFYGYTIKMGHTSAVNSASHDTSVTSVVKNAFNYDPVLTAAGVFDMITFDTNFVWNGVDNVLVEICSDGQNDYTGPFGQVRVTDAVTDGSRYYGEDFGTSCEKNTDFTNPNKPNVQFNYIDGTPPACAAPSALSVSNITDTSAILAWTDTGSASQFDVEVVTAGTAPTGTPTTAGVSNPHTNPGLTDDTSYEFYVRADCGGTDISPWSGPFPFTTVCTTFIAPYTQDFENAGLIPICFTDTGVEEWRYSVSGSGTHVGLVGTIIGATASGGYFAWVDASGGQANAIITTPYVDVSGLTTPALSFYELSDNEGVVNSQLDVEVWDGAAWNAVGTYNTNTAGWEIKIIDLSGLTITGDVQARFTFTEIDSSGFTDDIAIDDISFNELPSCLPPSSLTTTSVTHDTANITWTDGDLETSWDVELVDLTAGGTATGTPTTSSVVKPYAETLLTPNNNYCFFVRANCGGGDVSTWVGPLKFTTECAPEVPDYIEDFTTYLNPCWEEASGPITGPTAFGIANWTSHNYANIDGASNSAMFNIYNTDDEDWLLTPIFDLTGGGFEINLNAALTPWNGTAASTIDVGDAVYVMQSIDDGTTWTTIYTWDNANSPSNTGDNVTIDVSTVTSATTQFAIYVVEDATAGGDYRFYIDNFKVRTPPSCLEPINLMATIVNTEEVDITWTPGSTETDWTYEYGVSPYAQGGGGTTGTVSTTPSLSLTLLTPGETYDIYIQTNCPANDNSTYTTLQWTQLNFGDICEFPIDVATLPYTTTDDTANYGDDYDGLPGGTGCNTTGAYLTGDDVVYAYTATADIPVSFELSNIGSTYSGIFVYTDCADIGVVCADGASQYSSTNYLEVDIDVTNGTTYYVVISTWASPQSITYDLTISEILCIDATVTATVVDDCDNSGGFNIVVDITDLGSASSLTLSDNQASTDQIATGIGMFTFGPYANGTLVDITVVDDVEASCTETFIGVTQTVCPPANNICSGATALTPGNVFTDNPIVDSNVGTTDSGETLPGCASYSDQDVWYSVVVPADGLINLEVNGVTGGLGDTAGAAYSGVCGALVLIECDDYSSNASGDHPLITVNDITLAGQTIYFRVWDYNSNDTGEFQVSAYNATLSTTNFDEASLFTYYPNPVKNTLTLKAQKTIDAVSVYNMLGQEVLRTAPNAVSNTMDMAKLQSGAYFVRVTVGQATQTVRIIKN